MEIGVCRNGTGETDSGRRTAPLSACYGKYYTEQLSSCDDQQYKEGPSYWEYLFFDPAQIIAEMYPKNELFCRN